MPKLIRLGTDMTDAILTVLKYVKITTGNEPTQSEVAEALKSYFILNEIGNQIKFQRKKQVAPEPPHSRLRDPFWKMNLKAGPSKNNWVRAGLFYEDIKEALITVKRFVKDSGAAEPTATEIALSLKSSFILSEVKNQIDWQRNDQKKSNDTLSLEL
ncbi:MAG: hypothetical protein JRE88_06925 [Deltaproteobacteria bacterium]|nr:hypothetical protein [Deltaproteobacteria bacterium]